MGTTDRTRYEIRLTVDFYPEMGGNVEGMVIDALQNAKLNPQIIEAIDLNTRWHESLRGLME